MHMENAAWRACVSMFVKENREPCPMAISMSSDKGFYVFNA